MALPPFPILGAGKKIKKEITSRIEALGTTLPSPPTDFDFHDFGKMPIYFDLLVKTILWMSLFLKSLCPPHFLKQSKYLNLEFIL